MIVTQWSQRPRHAPIATVGVSLACIFLYLAYAALVPLAQQAMVELGGMQPSVVAAAVDQPLPTWWGLPALSLFTALFLHDSWLHLVGNLVYLWVFGIKVEQRIGSAGLLSVFLIVALRLPGLGTPIIGASGAVSVVVGAYLALFPSRHIGLFLPLGLYLQFARVPALFVIGSWFTLQLLYTAFGPINAAVAWWTHLAGFALGICFVLAARALSLLRRPSGVSSR